MDELILKEYELRKKIEQDINNSGLPAIILEPVVKDLLNQILILKQKQYAQAEKARKKLEEKNVNGKSK